GGKGGGADEAFFVDLIDRDGAVVAVTGDAPLLHEQGATGLAVAGRGHLAYRHRLALLVEERHAVVEGWHRAGDPGKRLHLFLELVGQPGGAALVAEPILQILDAGD